MSDLPRTEVADRPKRQSLWDLEAERREILMAVQERGGEIRPEEEAELGRLDAALLLKVDGYCYIIKKLEAEAAIHAERAKVVAARGTACTAMVERLKSQMIAYMQPRGMKHVKGEEFTVSINSSTIVVVDIAPRNLPERFQRISEPEANKPEIKRAIQRGEKVEGAHLDQVASDVMGARSEGDRWRSPSLRCFWPSLWRACGEGRGAECGTVPQSRYPHLE